MSDIKLTGKLRSISTLADGGEMSPARRGNMLTFSAFTSDKITDEIKRLLGRRVSFSINEASATNGHLEQIEQAALPLPVVETSKPESVVIVIKHQPMAKPIQKFDHKTKTLVFDWKWEGFCRTVKKAMKDKLPEEFDAMEIRFYFAIPLDEKDSVRLHRHNTAHEDNPPIGKLIHAVLDSMLDNKEAVSRVTASKYWTNSDGYIEVIFS